MAKNKETLKIAVAAIAFAAAATAYEVTVHMPQNRQVAPAPARTVGEFNRCMQIRAGIPASQATSRTIRLTDSLGRDQSVTSVIGGLGPDDSVDPAAPIVAVSVTSFLVKDDAIVGQMMKNIPFLSNRETNAFSGDITQQDFRRRHASRMNSVIPCIPAFGTTR